MANHFELELTNRCSRITMMNNVSDNFADEYAEMLASRRTDQTVELDSDSMTPEMRTIFETAGKVEPEEEPSPTPKVKRSSQEGSDEFKGKYSVYNYNKRLKARTKKIRTAAYMNFRVPNVQFVTLTFDPRQFPEANDLKACNAEFKKFIQRLHYSLDDFVYITTFSRQKNGNWHYHMLCNLDINVKNKLIQDKWGLGLTTSTPLTTYNEFDSRVSYCIDNMYSVAWEDLRGEKGYHHSTKLIKPVILRSWKVGEEDSAYEYLSKILNSTDKPLDVSSDTVADDITGDDVTISRKVSHKVFPELFAEVKVAKLKQKKR